MKPEQLKDLVALAYKLADEVIVVKKENLMPTWVMVGPQEKVSIIATPWRNDAEKLFTEKKMRQFFAEHHAVAYSVVTEAWMATPKIGSAEVNLKPSKHPERKEVVVALATDGRHLEYHVWEIVRDWEEVVIGLTPIYPIDAETQPVTWLAELLS